MRARGQDAQATVEFALVLPLLGLVLLAIVQLGVIADAQIRTTHAAREGARIAAVGDPPEAAVGRVLGAGLVDVSIGGGASVVTVVVVHRVETRVPLVGALLGDVELRAEASMLRESDG